MRSTKDLEALFGWLPTSLGVTKAILKFERVIETTFNLRSLTYHCNVSFSCIRFVGVGVVVVVVYG